jgi:hypothetical protein
MSNRPVTKESLLNQVDTLRDIARRTRRLSETMELESDRRRLTAHVDGIEECATRIEKQAIEAKTFVVAASPQQKKSGWLT